MISRRWPTRDFHILFPELWLTEITVDLYGVPDEIESGKIMRNVVDTLIPRTLELGGKYPFIVCEDVVVPHAQI
ncbi:hypothetical protein L6452_36552 [Arctium lappa]|uniref:Uncharacterized protein n=1 Tax=Arctium lappa TaxID=4217 RepID=A0ACB8YAR4_ARCLA|nr:hypothetical protein L6452_36552 [Arctium lappa]